MNTIKSFINQENINELEKNNTLYCRSGKVKSFFKRHLLNNKKNLSQILSEEIPKVNRIFQLSNSSIFLKNHQRDYYFWDLLSKSINYLNSLFNFNEENEIQEIPEEIQNFYLNQSYRKSMIIPGKGNISIIDAIIFYPQKNSTYNKNFCVLIKNNLTIFQSIQLVGRGVFGNIEAFNLEGKKKLERIFIHFSEYSEKVIFQEFLIKNTGNFSINILDVKIGNFNYKTRNLEIENVNDKIFKLEINETKKFGIKIKSDGISLKSTEKIYFMTSEGNFILKIEVLANKESLISKNFDPSKNIKILLINIILFVILNLYRRIKSLFNIKNELNVQDWSFKNLKKKFYKKGFARPIQFDHHFSLKNEKNSNKKKLKSTSHHQRIKEENVNKDYSKKIQEENSLISLEKLSEIEDKIHDSQITEKDGRVVKEEFKKIENLLENSESFLFENSDSDENLANAEEFKGLAESYGNIGSFFYQNKMYDEDGKNSKNDNNNNNFNLFNTNCNFLNTKNILGNFQMKESSDDSVQSFENSLMKHGFFSQIKEKNEEKPFVLNSHNPFNLGELLKKNTDLDNIAALRHDSQGNYVVKSPPGFS